MKADHRGQACQRLAGWITDYVAGQRCVTRVNLVSANRVPSQLRSQTPTNLTMIVPASPSLGQRH